jgi:hypothetical protein
MPSHLRSSVARMGSPSSQPTEVLDYFNGSVLGSRALPMFCDFFEFSKKAGEFQIQKIPPSGLVVLPDLIDIHPIVASHHPFP